MSSSVSAAMIVERNLELERQLLRDRRAELSRLARDVASLCAEALEARRRFGKDFPDLLERDPNLDVAQASLTEVDGSIARHRDWLQIERRRLDGAYAVHEVQQIMARVAKSSIGTSEQRLSERRVHAFAVLARLLPGVPALDVRALAEAAGLVADSVDDAIYGVGLLDLKFKAQRLNDRCVQVQAWSQRAQELLDDLAGFNGSDLDSLREELQRVLAHEIPMRSALPHEVGAIAAALREQADRHYAATVLAEELSLLGYAVGPDFQTVLVHGGTLQLEHAEMQEYQVEIESTGGKRPFRSKLSREDTGTGHGREQRDTRMQESWCDHLAVAFGRAKDRGVLAQVNHLIKAGEEPVEVRAKVQIGQKQPDRAAPIRKRSAERALRPNSGKE